MKLIAHVLHYGQARYPTLPLPNPTSLLLPKQWWETFTCYCPSPLVQRRAKYTKSAVRPVSILKQARA